jgi:hypothetical protein
MLRALQIELDARGYLDWDQWNLDGTNIRAAVLLRVRALMAGMRMTRPITRWVGRSAAWARKCIW